MQNSVDLYIGKQLKSKRCALGISQEELGKFVGISFQQIQKYEQGTSKISSRRLYEFAIILDVEIGFFFDEFNNEINISPTKNHENFLEEVNSRQFFSFVRGYFKITDKEIRKKTLELMRAIVNLSNVVDNKVKQDKVKQDKKKSSKNKL